MGVTVLGACFSFLILQVVRFYVIENLCCHFFLNFLRGGERCKLQVLGLARQIQRLIQWLVLITFPIHELRYVEIGNGHQSIYPWSTLPLGTLHVLVVGYIGQGILWETAFGS